MKIVILIQARLGSSRLPGKAALDMHGMPLLARVIARCRLANSVSEICVATSDSPGDEIVSRIARDAGATIFRGSLENVRQRMLGAAERMGADAFLRVTGDNPFTEPALIDQLVAEKQAHPQCPYLVHDLTEAVYGTAAELVDVQVLKTSLETLPAAGREHVTTGIAQRADARVLTPPVALRDTELSLTVDTLEQYQSVWRLMERYGSGVGALAGIIRAWRDAGEDKEAFTTRPRAE
ncbi:MAG: NTP transferase domain-containing protein [Pseudomonadota bacterium]